MVSVRELVARHDNDEIFWDAVEILSNKNDEKSNGCFYAADGDLWSEDVLWELATKADENRRPLDWGCGATKVALIFKDVVLKTSLLGYYDWDYEKEEYDTEHPALIETDHCEVEWKVYQAAKAAGLEEFFTETYKIADGVYVQRTCERTVCNTGWDDFGREFSYQAAGYLARTLGFETFFCKDDFPEEVLHFWVRSGKNWNKLRALAQFLIDHKINDLHRSNIGWFEDEIRLFDYSGFRSGTEDTF